MILDNPELHARRALQQVKEEERRKREREQLLQQLQPPPTDFELLSKEASEQEETRLQRLSRGSVVLFKGLMSGAAGGFVIGSIYGFRLKHANPATVGLSTALSMGLLFGQYAGLRFLLPEALNRHYQQQMESDTNENDDLIMGPTGNGFLDAIWGFPGSEVPTFLMDWTRRDTDVLLSAISGGLAGYSTNKFQAAQVAAVQQLKSGNLQSSGIRGGIFWSIVFGLGQMAIHKFDDYRLQSLAKQRVRELYARGEHEKLAEYLHEGVDKVPDRKQVVRLSWSEMLRNPIKLFQEYDLDWSWILPFVHEKEEYEKRVYLESKHRLLQSEVHELRERLQALKNIKE